MFKKTDGDTMRLIFKFKNPSFSEVVEKKVKLDEKPKKKNLNDTVAEYVNDNRYNNVFAKLNDDEKDLVEYELFQDAWKDYVKDNNTMDDRQSKLCETLMKKAVSKFILKK